MSLFPMFSQALEPLIANATHITRVFFATLVSLSHMPVEMVLHLHFLKAYVTLIDIQRLGWIIAGILPDGLS